MGKVSCEACNKKCKGQAIKLPAGDKYYHTKCFRCKECSKQLSPSEYFTRDGAHYCSEDYKKLFSVRCRACGTAVEGEVVRALENVFHPECFHCATCRRKLTAGAKVSYNGKEFICQDCSESSVRKSRDQQSLVPPSPTRPEKPSVTPTRPNQIAVEQQLNSPDSDFSTSNGRSPLSPVSMTSGYKSDASYEPTPDIEKIHAKSTGQLTSSLSCPNADSRGFLTPYNHYMNYRSTSPVSNASSRKSKESVGSGGHGRDTPNYGKFYQMAYMDLKDGYKRGPSINAAVNDKHPQHFHRPDGFSYRKSRTDINMPRKKAASWFSNRPASRSEPYKPVKTQEPIQLSKIPDAQKANASYVRPIERDDWPAPPAPAAAYPELLRERRVRRRSGRSEGRDSVGSMDFDDKENIDDDVDGPENKPADPKIEREIEELSKLPSSGAAQVMLGELKKKKYEHPSLDPRSASRTPNADREPTYRTRYESSIYASPSRDLDLKLQLAPLDDYNEPKYRTPSPANFLAPRPGYTLRSTGIESRNGYISDSVDSYYRRAGSRPGSSAAMLERLSCYSSQSDLEEYDPTTGLRRNTRLRSTAMSEGRRTPYSFAQRRSVPNAFAASDEPIKVIPFDELRLSNRNRPAGLDNSMLEQYLSKEEFEQLFHMPQEDFYRLAEWKRNDLKKRIELF